MAAKPNETLQLPAGGRVTLEIACDKVRSGRPESWVSVGDYAHRRSRPLASCRLCVAAYSMLVLAMRDPITPVRVDSLRECDLERTSYRHSRQGLQLNSRLRLRARHR
jgi:hypothetical protein